MESPAILFLHEETKCSSEEMEILGRRFWKGARVVATDAADAVGGLGVLWNLNLVSIMNIYAMCHLISAWFHILGTAMKGVVTNVYGPF